MSKTLCKNTVPGKPSDRVYIIDPHHHCSGELILKSEMFKVYMALLFFFLILKKRSRHQPWSGFCRWSSSVLLTFYFLHWHLHVHKLDMFCLLPESIRNLDSTCVWQNQMAKQ